MQCNDVSMGLRPRESYLEKLKKLKDEPFIKILSGVRRCGKSSILDLFERHLQETGVRASNILRFNFDERDIRNRVMNSDDLYFLVKNKLGKGRNYILLDEVQRVPEWEDALISMYSEMDADIYVTRSNTVMLSPDLATKLVGRFIEIEVLPLSFREWLDFDSGDHNDVLLSFDEYLRYGGFPAVALMREKELRMTALDGIYRTILDMDVGLKNRVNDPALLRLTAEYAIDSAGNIISPKSISDHLTSSGRRTTHTTIDNYLLMMEQAFLVYRCKRYNVKGKVLLRNLEKLYIVDTGLRSLVLSAGESNYGSVLENVIYLELRRRGYSVSTGKHGDAEIDFVATKGDDRMYIQVTASMAEEHIKQRELRPLLAVRDGYTKMVMSMDRGIIDNYEGIKNVNIVDWLLGRKI